MIRHIVLFKLKDGMAKGDREVEKTFGALRSLEGEIPGIRDWEVGDNFSERPIAVDYALCSSFDNREGLARYIEHPAHQEVVALLKRVCAWQVCDYEI
jgi:hypothetical protein